jgi:hypothetical protein
MAQKEAEKFRREILAVADQKATRSRFFWFGVSVVF